MSFWKGFTKRAQIGAKALQGFGAAGRVAGNKPVTGMSHRSAFKPNPVPSSKPSAAKNNMGVKLPPKDTLGTAKPKVKASPVGPAGAKI